MFANEITTKDAQISVNPTVDTTSTFNLQLKIKNKNSEKLKKTEVSKQVIRSRFQQISFELLDA